MKSYDTVIIGSGTAGQTAAYELIQHGRSVAVVEKSDQAGGTCALAGCQAKKYFYEGAELAAKSAHLMEKGIRSLPQVNWGDFLRQKNRFTAKVPENTIAGLKKNNIDVIFGTARFINDRHIKVDGQKVAAKHFIIASGARPRPLPIKGAQYMTTSRQFLDLASLPQQIVFIGGGFISFEFAHFASHMCKSDVRQTTILQSGPKPLKQFDNEMVSHLVDASKDAGIDIHTGVTISSIDKTGEQFRVIIGDGHEFTADMVVHGAGRIADIEDLDLERAGVKYSSKGIATNAFMQTTNEYVYAVGDCAHTVQLARVADLEALVAAHTILGRQEGPIRQMDYTAVPSVLFTYPHYAMVGETEQALQDTGIEYVKSAGQNLGWPTYRRIGMRRAAYKILAEPRGLILGAHMISDNATGIINTIRMAMLNRVRVADLHYQSVAAPYPSRESDLTYMLKPLAEY